MDNNTKQNFAQKSAQKYFANSVEQETLAKDARRKERTTGAKKIAKLRALRLVKEAADKAAADKLAAHTGVIPAARRKRAAAVKPVKMLRLSY